MRAFHLPIALYLVAFVTAFAGSLILTYAVRERARRARLFDDRDERKVHGAEIPRLGGVAVFASATIALCLVLFVFGGKLLGPWGGSLPIVLLGAAAVHFLGLYDDLKGLRARYKLLAQVVVSLAVFAAGIRVSTLSLPFVGILHFGPAISLLFTVLWLVGITNAFNLIDGLDGLASGAAMFALTTMCVVASINGQVGAALVTIILAGATLGFLIYNFHPASIFLGDSGSLFLGFMLAGVGLLSSEKGQTVVAVAIPIVALGLPVCDTLLSIVRRFLRGQPIFSPDRGHIHHRMLLLGHSPKKAALLLYGACALLALGGMLLVNDSSYVALILTVIGLGTVTAVQRLRYHEFQELGRLLRMGMKQRAVIGKGVRIREASQRLAELDNLDDVFGALEDTFTADEFQRTELRLRPSFLYGGSVAPLDRRLDDDVAVWTWSRSSLAEPSLWEIKLPLLDNGGDRVGSLVLWQDGLGNDTALSHMHTIAGELRSVVQEKVLSLWHDVDRPEEGWPVGRGGGYERLVPLPVTDESFRRADDRGLTAEPAVVSKPARRTGAGIRPRAS